MKNYNKLLNEFFTTKFVQYKPGLEGQCVGDDGIIYIGNRAGPITYKLSFNISNLIHEMSHLVEIDDERMRCHGWGLKLPYVHIPYYGSFVEPTDHRITDREIRVHAYQHNVLNYLNIKHTMKGLTDSFKWLPDTAFIPLEDGSSAYGEDENKNKLLNYDQIKKSQHKWIINQVKELAKEYTMDRFVSEWRRKMNYLNEFKYVIFNEEM